MMETGSVLLWFPLIVLGLFALKWVLKRVNVWIYESKLGEKKHYLPPGDLGWPFIGNMLSFLRAFKTSDPDSFIRTYITRYGRNGVYKVHMFGNPSVIVTTPETCRRVLTDDDAFQPGWPKSTMELIGRKSFIGISYEEHKRLRRLTSAPVNGHEALSLYIQYIEETVVTALEKWSKMGEIEFLTHVRKLTFRIIMYIFMSTESEDIMDALEREYTNLNYGVRAMAINVPGFAYHKALKARKNLVAAFQSIVTNRRNQRKQNVSSNKKDMLDNLGHESSGHTIMWATIFLQEHPEVLQKAKEEQEMIVKKRSPGQNLTLKETREMEYLSQVIDETLRVITFSLTAFREAKSDVQMNGYIIPKGWKVMTWFRDVHLDPEIYPDPKKFDPSRWEGYTPKADLATFHNTSSGFKKILYHYSPYKFPTKADAIKCIKLLRAIYIPSHGMSEMLEVHRESDTSTVTFNQFLGMHDDSEWRYGIMSTVVKLEIRDRNRHGNQVCRYLIIGSRFKEVKIGFSLCNQCYSEGKISPTFKQQEKYRFREYGSEMETMKAKRVCFSMQSHKKPIAT